MKVPELIHVCTCVVSGCFDDVTVEISQTKARLGDRLDETREGVRAQSKIQPSNIRYEAQQLGHVIHPYRTLTLHESELFQRMTGDDRRQRPIQRLVAQNANLAMRHLAAELKEQWKQIDIRGVDAERTERQRCGPHGWIGHVDHAEVDVTQRSKSIGEHVR